MKKAMKKKRRHLRSNQQIINPNRIKKNQVKLIMDKTALVKCIQI